MLASRQSRTKTKRRGIVLVLVLAMLALMAVIGVTFATYSGQQKISARNYLGSVLAPSADELLDFALAQLIGDTSDIRSAIRGHSLARDMYGNDAFGNSYIAANSDGTQLGITNIVAVAGTGTSSANPQLYDVTTSIVIGDPYFYGINFNRWIMRVSYTAQATYGNSPVDSTVEIVQVNPGAFNNGNVVFRVSPIDNPVSNTPVDNPGAGNAFNTLTSLYNPTLGTTSNLAMNVAAGNAPIPAIGGALNNIRFVLDGRYLHAFNGTGMTGSGLNAALGNFRYNGLSPQFIGMDEDYDACDLENWYLALQSADGQVMIPSFHRPAAVRYDPTGIGGAVVNDWHRTNVDGPGATSNPATSQARILRPVAFDGNDAATFPDLIPDPTTGKITYDVDNDGDGITDSVWVDLGYPARRDQKGQLYKPLFAFMVIGLNGRIPLNTAGNLADLRDASAQVTGYNPNATPPPPFTPVFGSGAGPSHASHLGNSFSEIDPTYGLQNGFNPSNNSNDYVAAFAAPQTGVVTTGAKALNTQVDNAGFDVRLTQLRNLLAGTRLAGQGNNENNFVYASTSPSVGAVPLVMPNSIADAFDSSNTDPNGNVYVTRTTQPVAGRWGEAQAIPGVPFVNPSYVVGATAGTAHSYQYTDVVIPSWSVSSTAPGDTYPVMNGNQVRAGYSLDPTDSINGTPRDMADDNYNSYDPWPLNHKGEAGDSDFYDTSGALLLPIDRMRRWLTPADINGTGTVTQWNPGGGPVNRGPDLFGRVEFFSYFRPPGVAGFINYDPHPVQAGNQGYRWGAVTISYPATGTAYVPDAMPTAGGAFLNNPLHGSESFRFPTQNYDANPYAPGPNLAGAFTPQRIGGMPIDLSVDANNMPTAYPTYDYQVNARVHSDSLNEADEMNLYTYQALLDSPYGPSDLEWLYRQQDIDGKSLTSRLKQLAPVSFTNGIDGQRRRRLFALDAWESNGFAWSNDNPGNVFPTNSRFASAGFTSNASMSNLSSATPALAHRDRKINLNLPLPVSNDPNEPIRQKWISDTYQMLKAALPPKSVDTPEELAQLSQYLLNVIDFRDTDSTMTHWVNPDVVITNVLTSAAAAPTAATTPPSLAFFNPSIIFAPNIIQLDQFGMEYNPVAINEALAYTFTNQSGGAAAATMSSNRFLIELVNTLTSPEPTTSSPGVNAAVLDLGGALQPASAATNDPYSWGAWDIVFTGDDPYSRPDPIRGDLPRFGNIYGLTPLNGQSFNAPAGSGLTAGFDVQLQPLLDGNRRAGANNSSVPYPTPANPAAIPPVYLPTNYFYVFGNSPAGTTPLTYASANQFEDGPLVPGSTYAGTPYATAPFSNYTVPFVTSGTVTTYPSPVIQSLNATSGFDPFQPATGATNPGINLYPGVLPGIVTTGGVTATMTPPTNYLWKVPQPVAVGAGATTQRGTQYIWVCLRRPANLFAPVSAYNPMIVVDSMRIPYIDGTGSNTTTASLSDGATAGNNVNAPSVIGTFNTVYSAQRFQPYRGGHAVPVPPNASYGIGAASYTAPANASTAIDTRYGYSEQIVPPSVNSLQYINPPGLTDPMPGVPNAAAGLTQGVYYYKDTYVNTAATYPVFHTLGLANEWEMGSGMSVQETWDYLPFHDRDFTSVAELMLVPATAPGMFTKQFVEFAPTQQNIFTFFSGSASAPGTQVTTPAPAGVTAASTFTASGFQAQSAPGIFVPATGAAATGTLFIQTYASTTSTQTPGGNPNNNPTPQPYLPIFSYGSLNQTTPANPYGPAPGYLYAATGGAGGGGTGGTAGTIAAYVNVTSASVPLIFSGSLNTATTPFPALPLTGTSTVPPIASPAQISPTPTPSPPLYPVQPHSYPYLSDKFFYTGFGAQGSADTGNLVGGYAADGWFKMFEFLEVPSQMIGSIGPVAQGTNFDWARQDLKPGLLNLNLIIDEEVYLSLLGNQNINQQNGYPSAGDPTTGTMTARNESDQFSQQLLNMTQVQPLPAGNYTPSGAALSLTATGPPYRIPLSGSVPTAVGAPTAAPAPIPLVVTATLSNGAPASAYPLSSTSLATWQNWYSMGTPFQTYPQHGPGLLAGDPVANFNYQQANPGGPAIYNNALKSSFVQFLWLRHGGSGYMFGWGNGAVGQNVAYGGANGTAGGSGIPAEIPFHSLSFPDIDYTIMRPAALPPNQNYTNPSSTAAGGAPNPATGAYYTGDPGVRPLTIYISYPTGGTPTALAPQNQTSTTGYYPGVVVTTTAAGLVSAYSSVFPPAIPARRLFQVPDAFAGVAGSAPYYPMPGPSNASETGDPYVNDTTPLAATTPPTPAPGVVPATVQSNTLTTTSTTPSNGTVNLFWQNGNAATEYQTTLTGTVTQPIGAPNNPYLGSQSAGAASSLRTADFRQHPYWRSEQMQRVMNLTTVRTHQYAVWITVGFFQVKRQGDIGMASLGALSLAFDIMGPEKGALDGTNVRYRAFYLIDRLRLTGFDPNNAGQFHQAVVHRQRIEF
jgi:hypothetical protein